MSSSPQPPGQITRWFTDRAEAAALDGYRAHLRALTATCHSCDAPATRWDTAAGSPHQKPVCAEHPMHPGR